MIAVAVCGIASWVVIAVSRDRDGLAFAIEVIMPLAVVSTIALKMLRG
jgi:hypothetical protein